MVDDIVVAIVVFAAEEINEFERWTLHARQPADKKCNDVNAVAIAAAETGRRLLRGLVIVMVNRRALWFWPPSSFIRHLLSSACSCCW